MAGIIKKACSRCGRIHEKDNCSKTIQSIKKITNIDHFRWSGIWKRKAESIKQRDLYMCRCCAAGMTHDKKPMYSCAALSVHHIEPLAERFDLRLEDSNLITLCSHHHEQAEKGIISKQTLQGIARIPPAPQGVSIFKRPTPTAGINE